MYRPVSPMSETAIGKRRLLKTLDAPALTRPSAASTSISMPSTLLRALPRICALSSFLLRVKTSYGRDDRIREQESVMEREQQMYEQHGHNRKCRDHEQ